MEKRKHPRFNIGLPVSFFGHTLTGSGQAQNLSMEGCRIEVDQCPENGDYLELTIGLPDPDPPLRIKSAVVRWVRDRVFGLEFLYMSTEATNRLDRLIKNLNEQLASGDLAEPADDT